MCLTCQDCRGAVQRSSNRGRPPKRCPACSKAASRESLKRFHAKKKQQKKPAHCERCGLEVKAAPRRGPNRKFCDACRKEVDRERRKASRTKPHALKCHHCGVEFRSSRRHQKCCSTACAHTMSRKRSTFVCKHCGVVTEMCEAYASRRHFCSKECDNASRLAPERICEGCGCTFRRAVSARFPHADKGKYCTSECYLDHRWGKDRPRRSWPDSVRARSSRNALATSLRKKCKILGVPYDAECNRQSVCDRDGWTCQKCGVECNRTYIIDPRTRRVHPRNAEHDHIIPLTDDESPGNVFPNSQCLCRRCNGKKRDTRWGQLRLDLEGSVQRWEDVAANRSRRNSKSSVAIQAVVP